MQSTDLYTPLDEALKELERRQKDPDLRRRVEDYFELLPTFEPLHSSPRIVLARPLFSPCFEILNYLKLEKKIGMKTLFCGFNDDIFTVLNPSKLSLGQMMFFMEEQDGQKRIVSSRTIFPLEKYDGLRISSIITDSGESLVDLHHRLLKPYVSDTNVEINDYSDWAKKSFGFDPRFPYLRYLGLFIYNGILFENFLTSKNEKNFTERLVVPAFERIVDEFGLKPLVVPLEPVEVEDESYWNFYPAEVQDQL
ncbi:MAG: hypothetical protein AAB573_02295 [Patescibacteria group bacterium]